MKSRKGPVRFLAVCAASAVFVFQLFALAGCGGSRMDDSRSGMTPASSASSDTQQSRSPLRRSVSLTVWGSEEDQPMLRRQCDAFCASYSGADVDVTLRKMDIDDAAAAAARDTVNAADVFAVKGSALKGLVRSGAVGENTLTADSINSRFSSDDLSAAVVNGKLYGYPCYSDTCVLYYDKSRFDAGDISSLEGMCEKIRGLNNRAGKSGGRVCPFAADFSETCLASSVFLTSKYGGTVPDSADDFEFDSAEGLEAARYIASLEDSGVEDMDRETAAARFKAGTLASYADYSEHSDIFRRALGDNYAAAELPSIRTAGSDRHLTGFSDCVMYAVNSSTAHPEEASALADYLTSDKCMLDRLGKRGLLPAGSRMASHPSVKDGSAAAAVRGQLGHSVMSPAAEAMEDIWRPAAMLGRELFGGKVSDNDIKGRLGRLSGRRKA